MASDTIRTVFGFLGNGTSLLLFLSPVPTFRDIRRNQSVEQYSAWPYVAALLNCMIWVVYGLPFVHPNSGLLISINGIGVLIEFAYVALFLRYSAGEVRHMVSLLLVAGVATVVVVAGMVLGLAHTEERRSMLMGMIGVASGSGMYVSQLGTMNTVYQTGSVEHMSLFQSVASLANASCWTMYALIGLVDLYVLIPNLVGLVFAGAQLFLYCILSGDNISIDLA